MTLQPHQWMGFMVAGIFVLVIGAMWWFLLLDHLKNKKLRKPPLLPPALPIPQHMSMPMPKVKALPKAPTGTRFPSKQPVTDVVAKAPRSASTTASVPRPRVRAGQPVPTSMRTSVPPPYRDDVARRSADMDETADAALAALAGYAIGSLISSATSSAPRSPDPEEYKSGGGGEFGGGGAESSWEPPSSSCDNCGESSSYGGSD